VNEQSVAWIAQRKNTLSMVFFLLSILWYVRASFGEKSADRPGRKALVVRGEKHSSSEEKSTRRPNDEHQRRDEERQRRTRDASVGTTSGRAGRGTPASGRRAAAPGRQAAAPDDTRQRWYWLSLSAFVLAMLSKGSVAILPGILLLLTWWRQERITRRDVIKILPFLIVAVGLTFVNLWFQARMPGGTRDVTALQRVLGAGAVIWFYVAKALVPIRLAFMYPQWDIRADEVRWWLPLIAGVAFTAVLTWQRRQPFARALLLGWAFVCIALIPVMGFTDVYFMKYSLVADHYEYIAMIGVTTGVAAGLDRLFRPTPPASMVTGWLSSGVWRVAILAVLGVATWKQAHVYAGPEVLYRTTIKSNPGVSVLHNNLGALLLDQAQNEAAAAEFREALRLEPDLGSAHSNLCEAAARLHLVNETLTECAKTVRTSPKRAAAHKNMGTALAASGRLPDARAELETAVALNPDSIQTHYDLADVLRAMGEPAAAASHYRRVLRDWPDAAGAQSGLGSALVELGQFADAESAFRESIRLNPDLADTHRDLADLLMQRGRVDDAIRQYEEALARDSRSADAHNNLGVALARAGRVAEAAEHFKAALKIQPDLVDARANLERISRK
jgi:tetratricopeptide (TPR) repeat protein